MDKGQIWIPKVKVRMEKRYKISLDAAASLDYSMLHTYDNFTKFLKLSREMNGLLINLNCSHWMVSDKQRLQYLYVALLHLDNVEMEIRISDMNEAIIRQERILDKIRSLRKLIMDYIRLINSSE
jgi:hypothetical protein